MRAALSGAVDVRACCGLVLGFALVLAGCGYHTAGHAVKLPTSVHTIAVPIFVNKTQSYRVEQILTAAVVREFTTRTQYRVVSSPGPDADATLRATVLQTGGYPITYDSVTGRASSGLVAVTVQVSLVDKQGRVLFDNPSYTFREQYQISRELSSFFDEETPALDRMARDFARTLVSNILEAF